MPIRPENRDRYPKDWKQISHRTRFERAGGQCEWEDAETGERCPCIHGRPAPGSGSMVILTTMHLDHRPENCADDNLLAGCQAHHNRYDRAHRNETRKSTMAARRATLFPALAFDATPERG